ncbi:MAG TPA: type VI secretion system contractile sheath large subunit [Pirellulaceae bacterium]|nr:type VI secretion system contractile sheath large subunit [Pirellulaceae bacterium]
MQVRSQSAAASPNFADAPQAAAGTPLLDSLLGLAAARADARPVPPADSLSQLLAASSPLAALRQLFGDDLRIGRKQAARLLDAAVARIDTLLSRQVNAVVHHPRLQSLEASWRGLDYLRDQARQELARAEELGENVRIVLRVLSATKRELRDDASTASQFDQSAIFRAVYESEFGHAGGEPFGLLIGDYEFRNHPDDLDTLASLGAVAAASFAPFVAAAAPQFFGLDDFQKLEIGLPLEKDFQRPDYIQWRELRQSEDMRFVGLTLPRVLMRVPYHLDVERQDGFRFSEDVAQSDKRQRYLWGNAAYAFGSVVLRAFVETSWFADIRGFERGVATGGLVSGLAVDSFSTDRVGVGLKTSTEVVIGGDQEAELSELGFIPLSACPGTEFSAFFSNASVHQPAKFADDVANTNAVMSAMLQYVLCASRFAHYLKVLCRQKIGTLETAESLQSYLTQWVSGFVADDAHAKPHVKARYPLRQAEVTVAEIPGHAGAYRLEMKLLPHYQLHGLSASLRLVHRLQGPGG